RFDRLDNQAPIQMAEKPPEHPSLTALSLVASFEGDPVRSPRESWNDELSVERASGSTASRGTHHAGTVELRPYSSTQSLAARTAALKGQIRNPKLEIRNKQQIQMTNSRSPIDQPARRGLVLRTCSFVHWNLFRIS